MAHINNWRAIKTDFLLGTMLAVICLGFQNSSSVFSYFISKQIKFTRVTTEWGSRTEANVETLKAGSYFISVGRPRGACEMFADDQKLDSNISEIPELRNGLLLGAAINQSALSRINKITINCRSQRGFGEDFSQPPVIAPLYAGIVLQFWRAITELLIGPISSVLIMLSFIFGVRKKETTEFDLQSPFETWRYFAFGLAALIYSSSLAYYTRFFLTGMPASIFMVVSKNLLNLTAMVLFTSLNGRYRLLVLGHAILLASSLAVGFWWPENIKTFYQWEYAYLPISSALITLSLFNVEPRSKSLVFQRRILLAWTFIQTVDLSTFLSWTDSGVYAGPSVVLLLGISAFYIRYLERVKTTEIEKAVRKVLSVVNSEVPVEKVLQETSLITRTETKYTRASAYVDGFCIGASESPGKAYVRIAEIGYRKDTKLDAVIKFSDGRGPVMAEANKLKNPILRIGAKDGAWFLVIPIGAHAFINLSNDRAESEFIAYESLEIVKRIFQSLLSLERRLIDLGLHQSAALQRLRSKRGDGSWDEEFGAIFVDINDYSRLADQYGNSFTKFISDIYIPSFIKAVSKFAVSEHMAGDEIYFIVTKDLVPEGVTLREAVVNTISEIDKFAGDQGSKLCINAGFSPLNTSVGVTVGLGTIVSDSLSVRTSGQLVNHAKRLQEEAGKNGILVSTASGLNFNGTSYKLGDQILIQKKKQAVLAQKVLRLADPTEETEEAS
jgi:class 3 adenylate cyclase